MKLKDFDYDLPKNLIAQEPVKPRDHSRLLVLGKIAGEIEHKHFYDIVDYLKSGDVLVLNNTKVMPARLIGKRVETGGRVEVFLLKKDLTPTLSLARRGGKEEIWQCLVGGGKRKENLQVEFSGGLKAEILKNNNDGTWQVRFNKSGANFMKIVKKIGRVPLPPYIKQQENKSASWRTKKQESNDYQTVYADEAKLGSVAAPTAGLHFTKELISRLKKKGVQFEYVTLRVGLGTFAPVKVDDITKHKMHAEWIEVKTSAIRRIQKAKLEGRRIVAVGTTSVRTLEALAKFSIFNFQFSNNFQINKFSNKSKHYNSLRGAGYELRDYAGWTDIFIYPGCKFKIVDAMITNFHLPKSTLLMLVSALAGKNKILKAYEEAIKKKYRFFSYGDAMLIM